MDNSAKYQPLAVCLLAISLGIIADRYFSPPLIFWILSVPAGLGVWLVLRFRGLNRAGAFAILAAFLFLGGLWHHYYWNIYPENEIGFYAKYEPQPTEIEGVLIQMPRLIPAPPADPLRQLQQEDRTSLIIRAEKIKIGPEHLKVSGKVAVSVEGDMQELLAGDRVKIYGHISKPLPPQNPGDFDYAEHQRGKRILCMLRVAAPENVQTIKKLDSLAISGILQRMRRSAQRSIKNSLEEKNAFLAQAMLLGIRDEIDDPTDEMMKRTGTLHILAISGMHIGLLAGGIYLMLRIFQLPPRASAVVLAATILFYLFLTDLRPPAIRATILVMIMCISLFFGRTTVALNSLAATAIVILLINPSDLFSFGPQLSFLATAVFLWVPMNKKEELPDEDEKAKNQHSPLKQYVRAKSWGVLIGFRNLFLISLTIWCATMPLLMEFTHLFTPVATLLNPLLWIPLTGILMSGFALMICGWACPPLALFFGTICNFFCSLLLGMIEFFHSLPYGFMYVPGPPKWWVIGFYLPLIFWTFFPRCRPKLNIILAVMLGWVLIGWCSGYLRNEIDRRSEQTRINVYSIGHGSCVLVKTSDGKLSICDAGCFSSPQRGADVLSRGIWRYGKTHIDTIILSHPDSDHYNSVPILAERFSIGTLYVSPNFFANPSDIGAIRLKEVLEERKIPIKTLAQGDSIEAGKEMKIDIYHPPNLECERFDSSDNNAESIVLILEYRGHRVMLPADLDSRRKAPFLLDKPVQCETMMVPHHGGNSSMTEPLIEWTDAKNLVISNGQFTYKKERMDAFRERGFEVHCTFEHGMIEITLGPEREINIVRFLDDGK